MSNAAFYLKYRPQSLDELVGQEQVKQTLLGAFKENRLSHAYLFAGPRGTGKTSTARILAKMVNCENSLLATSDSQLAKSKELTANSVIPCNKCSNCLSITDGSNMDLIEIDAASNRGIEDIRSLRDKIKLSPTNSKKKVYIIDEVHMLTAEAFNALLKTLEEPPSHALFILATTEAQKLPQTILSRVQRLDFKPSSNEELVKALKRIIDEEKIAIEDEALNLLVKKSEGSFRDGIKFLDQISSTGEKITTEVVQKNIKLSKLEVILDLFEFFTKKDTTGALSLIVKEIDEGTDPKEMIISLMDNLRSLVFIKNGLGEQLIKTNYSESNYEKLLNFSEKFENKNLVFYLEVLQKSLQNLKTSSIPSLPLELAVVEMTQSVILKSPQVTEGSLAHASIPETSSEILRAVHVQNDKVMVEQELQQQTSSIPSQSSIDDIQKLKDKWTFVLETIRPFNFSLEALLRSINITECTETKVIMEVPYSFHQRILEAPKNRDLLESVLSDILGRTIQIATVLGVRIQRTEDIANIEVAADDEIIRVAAEIFSSDTVN